MTLTTLAAVSTQAVGPTRLDPLELFLQADIIVQAVMVGLILASIWSWTIIIAFVMRLGKLNSSSREYERDFWSTNDREAMLSKAKRSAIPSARVAGAGLDEWRRSTKNGALDKPAARERIGAAMESQVAEEADDLAGKLTFLATTGSVAPFVGLFGTVWGIMNSFFQIGAQQSASLAVVAPGIAEALFATAIGLFAAIPAVIFYNRFSNSVNQYEAKLGRFADKVHAGLSRELDKV
ncbi:protein TolQ [Erythrobacter sp. SCSIO 43205]|uniref:protein TolQ n=1 Tax=Erythrobacter sp. SCSIO 43205 TaxID=2779361 RepID=UPI001CA848BA|nr:protein TolQ [Erythrobacter sp. SCSIO 43205]UAB77753.1 protein TolQ [Erythrobacter sp. SCSIO 43205]